MPGFIETQLPIARLSAASVEHEVRRQIASVRALDEDGEPSRRLHREVAVV